MVPVLLALIWSHPDYTRAAVLALIVGLLLSVEPVRVWVLSWLIAPQPPIPVAPPTARWAAPCPTTRAG